MKALFYFGAARWASSAAIAGIAIIGGLVAQPSRALDAPPTTPSASSSVVDDGAPGWTWSGFVDYEDSQLHGGSAHAGGPGNYAVYTFTGTSVDVYVMKGQSIAIDGRRHRLGSMQVSIDGHLKGDESVRSDSPDYNVAGFSASGLPSGIHVLKIDPQDGWVVVDYLRVNSGDSSDDPGRLDDKAAPAGPPVIIPEGNYRIYPRLSAASTLDDKDWKTENGTPLQLWKIGDHQKNQWFHLTPLGHGKYWMAPEQIPSRAMTMLAPNPDGSVPVGIWDYTEHPAQIWLITQTDDGWCRLSPSNAKSLALTVQRGNISDGTPTLCELWRMDASQEWVVGIQ